ncbi:MAG TPA: DUF4097 family beta strand repeat-containing protein [Aeromicrobium sp.]|nr:DUF4097 family beta strand repeat-containing protein [Aeromicrobium sp.]
MSHSVPDPEPEYEPQSLLSIAVRIIGSALAAVALVAVVVGVSVLFRSERTAVNRVAVGDGSQLAFRSSNSDLKIIDGKGEDVVIKAHVTNGLRETSYELRRDDNEFSIVGRCIRWLSPGCGVRVTIAVPDGYPLLIATGAGDVDVVGLEDRVVTVATGSGEVTGSKLSVQELSVNTDGGHVLAKFSKQPYALKVTTKEGNIRAIIPSGRISYLTTVKSTSGGVASSLVSDRRGDGLVRLLSDKGDIRVTRR